MLFFIFNHVFYLLFMIIQFTIQRIGLLIHNLNSELITMLAIVSKIIVVDALIPVVIVDTRSPRFTMNFHL